MHVHAPHEYVRSYKRVHMYVYACELANIYPGVGGMLWARLLAVFNVARIIGSDLCAEINRVKRLTLHNRNIQQQEHCIAVTASHVVLSLILRDKQQQQQ